MSWARLGGGVASIELMICKTNSQVSTLWAVVLFGVHEKLLTQHILGPVEYKLM